MRGRNDLHVDATVSSGSLAQSVEQKTFNLLVEGSNPSRPTTSVPCLNSYALVLFPNRFINVYGEMAASGYSTLCLIILEGRKHFYVKSIKQWA
jgi:hypothetical protein